MKSSLTISPLLALAILTACREDALPKQTSPLPSRTSDKVESYRTANVALAQQIAEGARLMADIQARYPGIKGIEISLFGEANPNPSMGLYIPEPELRSLTQNQISSLSAYLRTHIPKARKSPNSYMSIPPTAPFYARARENVAGIRDEAWFIGAGRVENGKIYYDRAAIVGSDCRE
jgi:hypothetical protein